MRFISKLRVYLPDAYICAILGMVALAAIFPARGAAAGTVGTATTLAIGLLFFLYGIRISPQAVWQGLSHWRLQATIFTFTFGVFPLLGLAIFHFARPLLGTSLATGVLFLCLLPSTVQSSIVFTSIARGNIAGALCAASLSNLVGMFVTPVLAAVILGLKGGGSVDGAVKIIEQLLAPFLLGQLLRPWLSDLFGRNRHITGLVDRGSILLVVYSAFSESVVAGLWHQLHPAALIALLIVNIALLATVMIGTALASRVLGFSREDRIAIVFCGSKKSLASGVPMANILFPAATVGVIVVPIMLFHQIQLMACAALARRYAKEVEGK